MVLNEYPLYKKHIDEHSNYLNRIHELIGIYENGKEDILNEILGFLTSWWENHIKQSDLKYAKYIKS